MIRSERFALYFLLPDENFVIFYIQPRYDGKNFDGSNFEYNRSQKSATLFVFLAGGSTYFEVFDFGMN